MKRILAVAAVLLVVACQDTQVPLATATQDVAGKQFTPPPAGMGALYVYGRSGNVQSIYIGPNLAGSLQGRTWLRADLAPGTYDVRCMTPLALTGAVGSQLVTLAAGETRYLYARESLGSLSCPLDEQAAATAQPAILAGQRVRELK